VFADNGPLAQSNAIILHLAQNTDLIPADPFERALMYQWLFLEQYSHEPAIAVLRFQKFYLKKPDSEIDPNLRHACLRVLALMDEHLGGRNHFVGKKLSTRRCRAGRLYRFAHQAGIGLAQYPNSAPGYGTSASDSFFADKMVTASQMLVHQRQHPQAAWPQIGIDLAVGLLEIEFLEAQHRDGGSWLYCSQNSH